MHSFGILVFAILFLYIGTHNTVAIDCYVCNSGGSSCDDPFNKDSVTMKPMPSPDGWCWKAKGELDGQKGVIRGGGPVRVGSATFQCSQNKCGDETIGTTKGIVCCCSTNLCNGAKRVNLAGWIFLFILLLFIIRY